MRRLTGFWGGVLAVVMVFLLVAAIHRTTDQYLFEQGIRVSTIESLSTQSGGSVADTTMVLGDSAATTVTVTTDGGSLLVDGNATLNSLGLRVTMPAVEVVASAATITANACGTVKRLSAAGAVTTSTTDTFTAPAAANTGCHMVVCNVDDTDTITLDVNTNFKAIGGANIALTAFDCTQVFSDGTFWYSTGSLVAN